MNIMKFSKRFKRFQDWLSTMDKRTSYTQRIVRLHSFYPNATLDQLRGHTLKEKQLKAVQPVPLYQRSWASLSAKERVERERALDVLSNARRGGKSLYRLSKEHRISSFTVRKVTNAFRKVKGRWKPDKSDRISRSLLIYSKGNRLYIEVKNSRHASIIGKYHSAIGDYLNNGNFDALAEFRGIRVRDSSGNWHTLETDPEAIKELAEEVEDRELNPIYESD
jgi:hypothetical protein